MGFIELSPYLTFECLLLSEYHSMQQAPSVAFFLAHWNLQESQLLPLQSFQSVKKKRFLYHFFVYFLFQMDGEYGSTGVQGY